jgi:hypothetical protein
MAAAPPRHVLVATDLSDQAGLAVRRAAQLGEQHDAQVTAVHVLPSGLDAELSSPSSACAPTSTGSSVPRSATVSLITVVGLITIGGSTYLIMYSHQIYQRIRRWLAVFERSRTYPTEPAGDDTDVDVILYRLGRFGSHLADRLGHTGYRILAVDFDPYCVTANTRDGVTAVFGSAEDIHLLDTLPLARARYVISTIPALDTKGRCCWGNSPQPLQSPDRGGPAATSAQTSSYRPGSEDADFVEND